MPFTPAHTAIVLPFLRSKYVSATALIAGAVAPDFEYFFKFSVSGVHGHTWPGLFYFDLPVALFLAAAFHLVAKKNFILSLPLFLQRRFSSTFDVDFVQALRNRPVVFCLSALLGAASHIIWDGFTHGDGFFVHYFSFYDGSYVPFQGVNYPLWYALQHISTFAGLALVLVYILMTKPGRLEVPPRFIYWIAFLTISLLVFAIRFGIRSSDFDLGNSVVTSISSMCLAAIVCGLMPFYQRHYSR